MRFDLTATTLSRIERHGIVIPRIAVGESERAKLELAVGCAFLVQESGGGHNVFGHDPSIYCGAGVVTKAKYLAYKAERKRTGKMQGVGPLQLTWFSYQDAADALGGCWNPTYNVREGYRLLGAEIAAHGLWRGAYSYNGSGPAAVAYADSVVHLTTLWRAIVASKAVRLDDLTAAADAEIAAARAEHADEIEAALTQTYLPKAYCWQGRSIQVRSDCRVEMEAFLHRNSYLRAFSGYRKGDTGDHRCGAALDMVPLTTDSRGHSLVIKAYDDAESLLAHHQVAYVEPLTATWIPDNHHLHVSWKRCS